MTDDTYWLTIALRGSEGAVRVAGDAIVGAYAANGARVIDVQPEPPQGATTVGPLYEDGVDERI